MTIKEQVKAIEAEMTEILRIKRFTAIYFKEFRERSYFYRVIVPILEGNRHELGRGR